MRSSCAEYRYLGTRCLVGSSSGQPLCIVNHQYHTPRVDANCPPRLSSRLGSQFQQPAHSHAHSQSLDGKVLIRLSRYRWDKNGASGGGSLTASDQPNMLRNIGVSKTHKGEAVPMLPNEQQCQETGIGLEAFPNMGKNKNERKSGRNI